jgi:putative FmdB family regulatory protein
MPTYEYVCKSCGHIFEIVQSMKDDALTECPECGGELRKVFSPPVISFKGSGFYATDHGKKSKQPASSSKKETSDAGSSGDKGSSGASSGDTKGGGSSTEKKSETKPASTSSTGSGSSGSGKAS